MNFQLELILSDFARLNLLSFIKPQPAEFLLGYNSSHLCNMHIPASDQGSVTYSFHENLDLNTKMSMQRT